jgi:TetR/AcrR family transcriptional regulator
MVAKRKRKRKPGRPSKPIGRPKLLNIARAAFAEDGYAGTSLSIIAEAAGIRKASLYYHFETKEALYFEVLASALGDLSTLIGDALTSEGPYLGRFDHLNSVVVDYFGEHPDVARLLVREAIGDGDFLQGPGQVVAQMVLDALAVFLEAGMKEGDFKKQPAKQLALSIVGMHLFFFASAGLSTQFIGEDIFSPVILSERKVSLMDQVRSVCTKD